MIPATRFTSAAPCLFVSDMHRSLTFYVETLGFITGHVEAQAGRAPVYVTLDRDGVSVHLARERGARKAGGGACCVFIENVDAFYRHCVDRGATIGRALEDSPYGLRDFNLRDPDGNEILFGEPIRK